MTGAKLKAYIKLIDLTDKEDDKSNEGEEEIG
jgi:hypothetical protein